MRASSSDHPSSWQSESIAFPFLPPPLTMLSWLSPYFNAPILSSSNNLSPKISDYSIAILQAGSFVGRVLSGILADAFGVWNMFVTMGMICAISLFAFWTAAPIPPAAVVVGMVAYGFSSGGWISLVAASTGAISPTREFGLRLGMLWSLSSIGILAGPVICGGESLSMSCDISQLIRSAQYWCRLATISSPTQASSAVSRHSSGRPSPSRPGYGRSHRVYGIEAGIGESALRWRRVRCSGRSR